MDLRIKTISFYKTNLFSLINNKNEYITKRRDFSRLFERAYIKAKINSEYSTTIIVSYSERYSFNLSIAISITSIEAA